MYEINLLFFMNNYLHTLVNPLFLNPPTPIPINPSGSSGLSTYPVGKHLPISIFKYIYVNFILSFLQT